MRTQLLLYILPGSVGFLEAALKAFCRVPVTLPLLVTLLLEWLRTVPITEQHWNLLLPVCLAKVETGKELTQ